MCKLSHKLMLSIYSSGNLKLTLVRRSTQKNEKQLPQQIERFLSIVENIRLLRIITHKVVDSTKTDIDLHSAN